jgi:hypothetical protein
VEERFFVLKAFGPCQIAPLGVFPIEEVKINSQDYMAKLL